MDDVVLDKAAIIERCVSRVREEHAGDDRNLLEDIPSAGFDGPQPATRVEASIDLAMHLVSVDRLGVPRETRDAFRLLREGGVIDADLAGRMVRMVGFRNVPVHDDRRLDLAIVRSIVTEHLEDFLAFRRIALAGATRRLEDPSSAGVLSHVRRDPPDRGDHVLGIEERDLDHVAEPIGERRTDPERLRLLERHAPAPGLEPSPVGWPRQRNSSGPRSANARRKSSE